MRNNTEEVKKNFLKKIKMILSIIILSLMTVPCITSCIHSNNPNNPSTKVEEPDPEEGGDPAAELVPSFTLEDKIIKALNDGVKKAIPTLADDVSEDTIEHTYAPLGLAYKKDDSSGKVYLLAKRDAQNSGVVNEAKFIDDFDSLKQAISKVNYKPYSEYPADATLPTSIGDMLEWRWQNLVKNTDPTYVPPSGFFPWFKFSNLTPPDGPVGKPDSVYYFMQIFFSIAVKSGNDPEVYFCNDASTARYLDWEITFVKGMDVYSFHVGPYAVKVNVADDDGHTKTPFPPVDDGGLADKYDKLCVHMLKLSTLVKLSLEQSIMKDLPEDKYAKVKQMVNDYLNSDSNPFGKNFANINDWNVYLTSYRILEGPSKIKPMRDDRICHAYGIWRNTFKLNNLDTEGQLFWTRCWN